MPRYELRLVFVPLQGNRVQPQAYEWQYYGGWDETSKKAWREAQALAEDGWEPVAMTTSTEGHENDMIERARGCCYSDGLRILFKRTIVE